MHPQNVIKTINTIKWGFCSFKINSRTYRKTNGTHARTHQSFAPLPVSLPPISPPFFPSSLKSIRTPLSQPPPHLPPTSPQRR
ncbi:hypothetical protein L211DRAFT_208878 [Terfezia boudieri ATCC MYA-4762]|uniref:Uncharacterized protein n=1 Tax=Terfezia boudieri ATCC MYA-4762 TaxID=1051890 RepID=A0A3N4LMH5_9PEZI|nr:hypothetical protein L211DRAFT_208878 [Terfezia boudieri ATCC MYA-4762]